jgi:hypothetical protein
VLQGVAWATPALVVATAVPAAAASQTAPGYGLIVASTSGYQDASKLYLSGVATYQESVPGGADDYPVTGVTMVFRIPSSRVTASSVSFTGTNWSAQPPVTGGGYTTLTYKYSVTLTKGAPTSTPLSVTLTKPTPSGATSPLRTALTVDSSATGTSNGHPTSSLTQVAVGAYSILTIGTAVAVEADGPFTSPRYLRTTATIRNNVSQPNAGDIVGIVARLTVPNASVGGTGTAGVDNNAPWQLTSTVPGASTTVYTFTHTASPLPPSNTPVTVSFRTPFAGGFLVGGTVSVTFEGHSPTAQGAVTSATGSDTYFIFF